MPFLRIAVIGCLLLLTACRDDDGATDDKVATSTTAVTASTSTSGTGSSSTGASASADEIAARSFIDAWRRGDLNAMKALAPPDQVDIAVNAGRPVGEPTCSTQRSGQYQCDVDASKGARMYLLIGQPGGAPGRVWWVAVNNGD